MWHRKTLTELTSTEFYQLLKLRIDTFVVAQKRIYHELDEHDLDAIHVFYRDEPTGIVLAYARIFPAGDHVTFGRVVTAPAVRGQGFGEQLMTQLLNIWQERWSELPLSIESQQAVVGFYEKFGFVQVGAPFIFESTPHIEMRLSHEKN